MYAVIDLERICDDTHLVSVNQPIGIQWRTPCVLEAKLIVSEHQLVNGDGAGRYC